MIDKIIKSFLYTFTCIAIVFGQSVERITTFENEDEMGVLVYLSQPIEIGESISHSPDLLIINFPETDFLQGKYSSAVNLPPLYRIDAKEEISQNYAESKNTRLKLYFTKLPDYEIRMEGARVLRIFWEPLEEDIKSRETIQRLSMFETNVSLNFKDARIVDLLRLLAVQNRLNIITSDEIEGEVTVSLKDVPLGAALDAILKVNGYDWFLKENIIVIKSAETNISGELETRIYKLEYVDAGAVSTALSSVLSPKGRAQVFSPVSSGGGAQSGGGGGGQGASGGAGGLLSSLSGNTQQAGGSGQQGESGGQDGGQNALSAMDHILVTDAIWNFKQIEAIINQLDQRVPQINIAVKFIETTLTTNERLGINWSMRADLTGPQSSGTDMTDLVELGGGLKIGSSSLKIATLSLPVFTSMMEILSTDDNTRLIQEPQVTTRNNTTANVKIGTSYPIIVPQSEGGLVGTQPVTFQDEDIDITMKVHPRINEGRFVTMDIDTKIQALVGFRGPDADRPVISERSTQTQVTVGDQETLLIGGLIFDQDIETVTSVPFLGKIPIIKKLFTHKITSVEQRELLIFITPTIMKF